MKVCLRIQGPILTSPGRPSVSSGVTLTCPQQTDSALRLGPVTKSAQGHREGRAGGDTHAPSSTGRTVLQPDAQAFPSRLRRQEGSRLPGTRQRLSTNGLRAPPKLGLGTDLTPRTLHPPQFPPLSSPSPAAGRASWQSLEAGGKGADKGTFISNRSCPPW